MDVERIRAYLLSLPHVIESVQFGGLVFWIGDKAIGGKMFAWMRLEQGSGPSRVISYPAGPERYSELLEIEGILPAPYLARIHWVAVESWTIFRPSQWQQELSAAHALTFAKLPTRTRDTLALPITQQRRLITERRKILAAKSATKKKSNPPSIARPQTL